MSRDPQLSIEFNQPASPESIAALRNSISSLPEAIKAEGIADEHMFGPAREGGLQYEYQEGFVDYQCFYGRIDMDSKTGPQFTAAHTREISEYVDYFVFHKWQKEITFTEDGGMLITDFQFDEHQDKLIGKDTHPASQADLEELAAFVTQIPGAMKASSEARTSYKAAYEKSLARASSRRAKAGRFIRRLHLVR